MIRASPYYVGSSQSMHGGFYYTGRGGSEFWGVMAGAERVRNIRKHQKGGKKVILPHSCTLCLDTLAFRHQCKAPDFVWLPRIDMRSI
jgi:hypothetical protein